MTENQSQAGTSSRVIVHGWPLNAGSREDLVRELKTAVSEGPQAVFFCNVHMLMISQDDAALAEAMASANLLIPDGVPLAWLQRRLGHANSAVLRGYEAVRLLCAEAAASGKSVGFLGSTDEVLDAMAANLRHAYPGLEVALQYSPPISSEALVLDRAFMERINSQELFCLFVGLGCPKQEKWVARHAPELNCSLLAVGAAFGWLAGTTRKPPAWMERSGLGWLFRLVQNPRKMWHRYLVYNTRFIISSAVLLGRTNSGGKRPGS